MAPTQRIVAVAVAAHCFVVTSAEDGEGTESPCDGIALSYWGDESDKTNIGLFIAYGIVMAYIFGGVAVAADAFMGSIEAITAETRLVTIGAGTAERDVEVGIWNKTVSNLSLMALGSSAPEILLAIIEVIGNNFKAGDLGPGTIVGSAAFNMLMIIAICVSIEPVKRVESINVLYITAFASLWAYLWLYLMVDVVSPKKIEIWEAVFTCLMFPMLLVVAYFADKGWFDGEFCHHKVSGIIGQKKERDDRLAMMHLVSVGRVPVHATGTSEWNMQLRREIRRIAKENPELKSEEVYIRAFELIKSHDHAPVLDGELARAQLNTAETALNLSSDASKEVPDTDSSPVQKMSSTSSLGSAFTKAGFTQSLYKCIEQNGTILLPVTRRGNINFPLQLAFEYRNATAEHGRDFSFVADTTVLNFEPGVSSLSVEIKIVDHEQYNPNHHFFVSLKCVNSADESQVKWTNKVTKIRIIDKFKWKSCMELIRGVFDTIRGAEPAESAYLEQIRCAIRGDDGADDVSNSFTLNPVSDAESSHTDTENNDETSYWDWFVYLYLVVPSVLLAIFSVPVTKYHGWGLFFSSLLWIGVWTLLAGDLATGMGCTVGLADTVTAITFVALGTSVPDTFASKIAAETDDTADPAIGNVTGSNAVNVFLGVGLSWLVGAIYQKVKNDADFVVQSGSLAFSVLIFSLFLLVWFGVLTLRRYTVGGELGGSGLAKWGTVALFMGMWFLFILLVALVEYGDIDNPF